MTLCVRAFLLITFMENPLFNSSSNITKSAIGTGLIQRFDHDAAIAYDMVVFVRPGWWKWQTRKAKDLVAERLWEFKSPSGHHDTHS